MLKSMLVINVEAHDKLCGLKCNFSVARMVFSIIVLVINDEAHDKLCGLKFTFGVAHMAFDIKASDTRLGTHAGTCLGLTHTREVATGLWHKGLARGLAKGLAQNSLAQGLEQGLAQRKLAQGLAHGMAQSMRGHSFLVGEALDVVTKHAHAA